MIDDIRAGMSCENYLGATVAWWRGGGYEAEERPSTEHLHAALKRKGDQRSRIF